MSLSNSSIVTRAWILLGSVMSILAFGILASWLTNVSVRNTTDRLVNQDYAFQLKVLDLQLHIVQVQQWLTDISATRGLDGLDDGYAEAEKHAGSARQLIDEISIQDPDNSEVYRKMQTTFDSYYQTGKQMAGLYVAEGPTGGNAFMSTFDKVAASMSAALDKVLLRAAQGATNRVEEIRSSSTRAIAINLGISLLIMLGLLGGLLNFIRLLNPLTQIRQSTVQLADNDLTFEITPLEGQHEIAVLTTSFEHMKTNLKRSIHEIGSVASTITHTTEGMSQVAEQTLQGVSSQNQEIEQIATAINQMAATVQEVSRNTAAAATSANQANEAVNQGGEVIEQAVAATRRLADEVSHGADVVSRLSEESEGIDRVLTVIRGIAEQTNLLALNAAIEAARAGEQGRGFAVVADEVRTLASKTQDSTMEIQQMIERLQSGSSQAASAMTQSREQADMTARLAADAGKSLVEIRDQVSRINEMSVQIATASEEQGTVANEIHRNIEGIRVISEQTTSAAQQTSEASDSLSDQAVTLHRFVGRFKV